MKKYGKPSQWKCIAASAAVLLSGILTGCAGQDPEEDVYLYVPEYLTPEEGVSSVCVLGEWIYYSTPGEEIFRWKPGKEAEKIALPPADGDRSLRYFQPDWKGNLYVLYEEYYINETDGTLECAWELARNNISGEEMAREDITREIEGFSPRQTAVDKDGRLFVNGGDRICLFDTDCSYKGKLEPEEDESFYGIADSADGTVYCCAGRAGRGGVVREISFEEGISKEALEGYEPLNGFSAYMDRGFLTSFNDGLYLYDRSSRTMGLLLEWSNCNIYSYSVKNLDALEDGRIVAFLQGDAAAAEGEIAVLTRTEASLAPERETVTLGTLAADENLMRIVARFNRENGVYRIEMKEYYDTIMDSGGVDTGKEGARTALNLDIVSGRCPDILVLEPEEAEGYAGKGLLEDLAPYLEKEDLEILPNVREACTFDGKLAALPCAVKVRTMVGRAGDVGKRTGWTLEEMMEFMDSHEGEEALRATPGRMLEYCLTFNQADFVDWEEHSCDFESEEFGRVLEFCGRFTAREDAFASVNTLLAGGSNALIHEVVISQPEDITLLEQYFGEDGYVFTGFPTVDGKAGNLLEAQGGLYAIFARSGHKEAAWEFLRMVLTDTGIASRSFASLNAGSGFPVERESYEEYLTLRMEEPYVRINGELRRNYENSISVDTATSYCYYVPLPEEVELAEELLESAMVSKDNDREILAIVREEAAFYFDGTKSAREVSELIQNRVSLYLQENR